MAPIRLLTFSTLYPNPGQPNHGVFVENRLRHLVASGEVVSTVLAPVPYFPRGTLFRGLARAGGWRDRAEMPTLERRHGIAVHHPRYVVIPRIGMNLAPALLYHAASRALRRMVADGLAFDAIDAHYVYPDGVAAIRLGRAFGKPVVITARGSDITQLPDHVFTPADDPPRAGGGGRADLGKCRFGRGHAGPGCGASAHDAQRHRHCAVSTRWIVKRHGPGSACPVPR